MITIHIPEGKDFDITKEIMSAQNIKDKQVRVNTLTGLKKISHYL